VKVDRVKAQALAIFFYPISFYYSSANPELTKEREKVREIN